MDKQKSIEALQFFVTGLSEGAFVHKVQGQIFKAQGFTKLGEKYIGHYTEEMEWVEKFIDRILDLGGEVKVEKHEAMREFGAPVNAGKIAEITGIDRKEVDKAFAELKKEGAIVSPVRCKWQPA